VNRFHSISCTHEIPNGAWKDGKSVRMVCWSRAAICGIVLTAKQTLGNTVWEMVGHAWNAFSFSECLTIDSHDTSSGGFRNLLM
jgi:hypothetical protein